MDFINFRLWLKDRKHIHNKNKSVFIQFSSRRARLQAIPNHTDRIRETLFCPPNLAGTATAFGGFNNERFARCSTSLDSGTIAGESCSPASFRQGGFMIFRGVAVLAEG